jgi:hypothetical protein
VFGDFEPNRHHDGVKFRILKLETWAYKYLKHSPSSSSKQSLFIGKIPCVYEK